MKSSEYWIKREKARRLSLEKDDTKFIAENAGRYKKAFDSYKSDLGLFYASYAEPVEGVLTVKYTEAVKALTLAEKRELLYKVSGELEKVGVDTGYKAFLTNLKKQAKIPRLQLMNFSAQKSAHELAVNEIAEVTAHLKSAYEASYGSAIKLLEDGLGLKKIGEVSANKVRLAISHNWSGTMFSDRIWTDKTKLVSSLQSTLTNQFVRNKPLKDAINETRDRFNVKGYEAERIVRTESARVVEEATATAYQDAGVEEYEYVAIEDERTSSICKDLNGQIFPLSEAVVGVNYPPMHPNCRSTTIPVIEGL